MAITVGATTATDTTATSSTTSPSVNFTPNSGADKVVLVAAYCYTTVAGARGPITATFGGNAMTLIEEVDNAADPGSTLALFAYPVGSSTTLGAAVATSTTGGRWNIGVCNLIDVPSQTPVDNESNTLSALSVTLASAGILIDVAANHTDDAGNTNNTITIDGTQTSIFASVRGAGGTTEGRLTMSYKTVGSGSQSGASSSPFSDGVAHLVAGWLDSVGGGAYTPRMTLLGVG